LTRRFDVIETAPARLGEADGIGPIVRAWVDQKATREILLFLHDHGVSTARAIRILKSYGAEAIAIITDKPYRLARDRFRSAAIAERHGIAKTAMIRGRAGIRLRPGGSDR
jgi:exodeoxyribonuclease V alpha subunit